MLLDADPVRGFMPYPAAPVAHARPGPPSGLSLAGLAARLAELAAGG
jgi:hypothetical protein